MSDLSCNYIKTYSIVQISTLDIDPSFLGLRNIEDDASDNKRVRKLSEKVGESQDVDIQLVTEPECFALDDSEM